MRKILMLLALGLMLAPIAHAQSVDDLLAKHYEACGGLAKMKAVNTVRVTGSMTMGPGMEAPITMERKRPGMSRMEFTIQGMTGVQAFDGAKMWSLMPFMGKKDPEVGTDEDNKNALDDADFDGPLVDYKTKGHTIELVGKESVDGADAYKLKVTKKSGTIEYYYLDAETYLLVKTEGKIKRRGTEMDGERTFSDYKDVDGLMQAFSMEIGTKEMKQKLAFSKFEMNVPLDDARFAVPAGATGASAPAAAADSTKAGGATTAAAPAADSTKKDTKGKASKSSSSKKKG